MSGDDPAALAAARRYDEVSLPAALWSLEQSADAWTTALTRVLAEDVVLLHVTRGPQSAADVFRNDAQEAHHHARDVLRSR